jgi:hypothetical protein
MSFRIAGYFLLLPCLLKSQEEKVLLDFNKFNRWTIEVKFQKFNYLNGRTKSEGNFLVYTTDKGVWTSPINRHILYRRNVQDQTCFSLFRRLRLLSLNGQVLLDQTGAAAEQCLELNGATGLYILEITSGQGVISYHSL